MTIRPAGRRRQWMNETKDAEAYKCLPLVMANHHGWEICAPVGFEAVWNGGAAPRDVSVITDGDAEPGACGHFGSGILSFHLPAMFRTPPGFNLWLCGPINQFKDSIQALSAMIETDWMPYSFSVNWQFTRPDTTIRFEKGDAIAHIFPVPRGMVESFDPEIRALSDQPEDERQFNIALLKRATFSVQKQLGRDADSSLIYQGWYMRGVDPEEKTSFEDHQTALKVRPFKKADAE